MLDAAEDMRHGPAESTNAARDVLTTSNNRRRRLNAILEWGVSRRACHDKEHKELAAAVCPWRTPAEAADLLKVLMPRTA